MLKPIKTLSKATSIAELMKGQVLKLLRVRGNQYFVLTGTEKDRTPTIWGFEEDELRPLPVESRHMNFGPRQEQRSDQRNRITDVPQKFFGTQTPNPHESAI